MDKDTDAGRWDWLWLVALVVLYTIGVILVWDLFQWYIS